MPTDAAVKDEVWAALTALPTPVTIDQARECVGGILGGKQKIDFDKWLTSNSTYVLRRLNG